MRRFLTQRIRGRLRATQRYYTLKGRRFIGRRLYASYSVEDLLALLKDAGVTQGRTVFVHSSWDSFTNFQGTALELLQALQGLVGSTGTLAMPAYPAFRPDVVFDVHRTPTVAGLLPELFRRTPGVCRSINLDHSVCALGPRADFLTKDHHRSVTSWDECSPYYRAGEVDAVIVSLGAGRRLASTTTLHCVESLLRTRMPFFSRVFGDPVTYRYKDWHGQHGQHTYLPRIGTINPAKVARRLQSPEYLETGLSNLEVSIIGARFLIDASLALAKQGITIYTDPRPRRGEFRRLPDPSANTEQAQT